jgi:exodeoxyribonuclease III
MRIATFNVNSIRARLPRVLEWLEEAQPDIVAIQETKVEDAKFPFADLEPSGYEIAIYGQPRYNGVCFLSKGPLEDVHTGFGDPNMPEDARIIRAVYNGVQIINTYVPNGTQVGIDKWDYKLAWLERFGQFCKDVANPDDPTIWLGDINIAPTADDVFEPQNKLGHVGHHPDEFSRLKTIIEWGWTDTFRRQTPGPGHYTFFDFRLPMSVEKNLGWRIDHIYASPPIKKNCKKVWCDIEARKKERPSDHAPLIADFEF